MSIYILLTIASSFFFIILAIVIAVKNKEGGNDVIRHLYTYLVLFATLMMVIGGGISIFMATADLISPPAYYQSFDDYKQMKEYNRADGESSKLSDEELKKEYDQIVIEEKARQKEMAKNQIIKSLGFIIIPLPIFLYFNRMRKKLSD